MKRYKIEKMTNPTEGKTVIDPWKIEDYFDDQHIVYECDIDTQKETIIYHPEQGQLASPSVEDRGLVVVQGSWHCEKKGEQTNGEQSDGEQSDGEQSDGEQER